MIPTNIPNDCRELWRVVAECVDVLNALQNMTVKVEGKVRMIGKLDVKEGSSILQIEEKSEVGSLGG
jgi:hypothetical protein